MRNRRDPENLIFNYYLNQAGRGDIYRGLYTQKGKGVGSFLAGLYRYAKPIFKNASMFIGKELLTQSKNILNDIGEDNCNFSEIMKNHGSQGIRNVKKKIGEKLLGGKVDKKNINLKKSSHLSAKALLAKLSKKKKPKKKKNKRNFDIFD